MINYTERLDSAIRKAAWAHEQQEHHRKGTDIPYIIHPVGVMIIASNVTDDEDTLIACLMHDVLEDVDSGIYDEHKMQEEFGERVVAIVKDVTTDESVNDWHERSRAYLHHLEHEASNEAVIVSASDKIHNLQSTLTDHATYGENLWARFETNSSADQLWWYESILEVISTRGVPEQLRGQLAKLIEKLQSKI
jgi:(p)ppGpp synthase/HD superfamily hydrolase